MKNIIYRGYKFEKYLINEEGIVFSNTTGKLKPMKIYSDKLGYKLCELRKEGVRFRILIHRALYETFIGAIEEGMVINHINGVKYDNSFSNLEVCTMSQNSKHAFDTGLTKKRFGEELYNIVVSDDELVEMIIEKFNTKKSYQSISINHNCNRGFLSSIFRKEYRAYIWDREELKQYKS